MSNPLSPSSKPPSSSADPRDKLAALLGNSVDANSVGSGISTSTQSPSIVLDETTDALRRQVLGYVGALDDSEFAQLVADARGTNAKDAAAAALEQFIRHR
jgi:hypothetical protein